ncbi:MAG: hypothetical protein ACK4S2_03375 [Gemmobacter sp.]
MILYPAFAAFAENRERPGARRLPHAAGAHPQRALAGAPAG